MHKCQTYIHIWDSVRARYIIIGKDNKLAAGSCEEKRNSNQDRFLLFPHLFLSSRACLSERGEKKRENATSHEGCNYADVRDPAIQGSMRGGEERGKREGKLSSRSSSIAARAARVKYLPRFVSVHRRVSNHFFVLQCTGKSLLSYSMRLLSVTYRNKRSLSLRVY